MELWIHNTVRSYGIPRHRDAFTLPNDKTLDSSKFKAFADDKIMVDQKLRFVLGKVENIVGKGEHAGYQHFLLFPQCFQKLSFPVVLKSWNYVVES